MKIDEIEKNQFIRIDGRVLFVNKLLNSTFIDGIVLANPKDKQKLFSGYLNDMNKIEQVSSKDLVRLWPHRTHRENYSWNKTEPLIKAELESRKYSLSLSTGKWVK